MRLNKAHIYFTSRRLMLLLIASLVLAITTFIIQPVVAAESISSLLIKYKLYPDHIYDSNLETLKLEIHGNIVKPGDSVPAKNFKSIDINKVSWDHSQYDINTLMLIDLDRKTGPNNTQSFYNQYTNINIPGNQIRDGQAVVSFEPPNVPCQPTVKHRLLALVLTQRQSIDLADIIDIAASKGQPQKRENFNLANFIRRHGLTPTHANLFNVMGDVSGVCSGSSSAVHYNQMASILIAMVIAITVPNFSRGYRN